MCSTALGKGSAGALISIRSCTNGRAGHGEQFNLFVVVGIYAENRGQDVIENFRGYLRARGSIGPQAGPTRWLEAAPLPHRVPFPV